ncbi:chromate efflux transporter [Rhodocyclaceae bacterium SMB388]
MQDPEASQARPAHPSFTEALLYWLKLGFISFGGPAGQISMMHHELVERRRWISERRFLHALNFCMLLPGPEAQQLAIYLGWLLHRTWGGIVAGVLFVLPSLFILAILTWIYLAFGDVGLVQGVFTGIKPAVVAIVIFAAWRIGSRALKNEVMWAIAAAAFIAIFVFRVPFPLIVLGAATLGLIGGRLIPAKFQLGGGHGSDGKRYGPAVIDDDTPALPHTRYRSTHLVKLLAGGLALWLVGILLLPAGILTDMGIFFTKAALLTFGGAYAVLPYVYQGGVDTYGWLTGTQMIDGLALGESTPGPLIMIVAFVGFVGTWTHPLLGPDSLFLAGLIGASVATFFTFLPSFLFILAGGALVESTHGNLKFTAPLSAITAAVVGVILNLALFFGWQVLWPDAVADAPFSGGFDAFSAGVAVAAFIALWRYKVDILKVLGLCAVLGLIHGFAFGY